MDVPPVSPVGPVPPVGSIHAVPVSETFFFSYLVSTIHPSIKSLTCKMHAMDFYFFEMVQFSRKQSTQRTVVSQWSRILPVNLFYTTKSNCLCNLNEYWNSVVAQYKVDDYNHR